MAYCEKSDILGQISEDQLINLTDDKKTGAVDETIIAQAIAEADAEIDGWVGKRYSVPLFPVPAMAKKISTDFAVCNIYKRRRGLPEDRKLIYDNDIAFLKAVSKGDATLGVDDPTGSPQDGNAVVLATSTRLFNRDNLKGF